MKRKWLTIGIILLFVGTCIVPVIAQTTENSQSLSRGNWLYVGGSGPGNYTKIQDAINDSTSGDTIYVYNGTYHEAIQINVENLQVIGEGRDATVIDANSTDAAVVILQSYVVISGFTITGKNNCIYVAGDLTAITISNNNITKISNILFGVYFEYDGDNNCNVLENNVFYSNSCGIGLASWYDSGFNSIRNNTFVDNFHGIEISGNNNRISNNSFLNCRDCGINLFGGTSTVEDNIFIGNEMGLDVGSSGNRIIGNHFENNTIGLRLFRASNTSVTQNNFMRNGKHATFSEESRSHGNTWDNNYWGGSFYLFGCMFIFGKINTGIPRILQFDPDTTSYYWIRWINFDKYPAQEPYYIP